MLSNVTDDLSSSSEDSVPDDIVRVMLSNVTFALVVSLLSLSAPQ